MVLVAPSPAPGVASPARSRANRGDAGDAGDGRDVLALLRGDSATRPRFDPALPGGLRAWLEDAAYDVVAARGDDASPLVLGSHRLLGSADPRPDHAGTPDDADGSDDAGTARTGKEAGAVVLTDGVVLARLVHVLFRQIVTAGEVRDPLSDALEALRATGGGPVVGHVESLPRSGRAALADALAAHAATLERLVPRFAPGWMPRTEDHVAIPLAGGRVVLHGIFDLLVGLPRPPRATLCALGLSTGGPWVRERRSLHFLALLETLRSGAPPFRLALLDSGTGRYGVEDVREEHLRAIASHIAAWLAAEVARGV